MAMRWFRSQLLEAPVAKFIGSTMLLASFSAELALFTCPKSAARFPPAACSARCSRKALRAAFNPLGANLVSIATLLTALFLTTSFSFRAAVAWMKKPMAETACRQADGLALKIGAKNANPNAFASASKKSKSPDARRRSTSAFPPKHADEEEEEEEEPKQKKRATTLAAPPL